MARLNVRLPILTIEREAPFFWVSLGLREADAFRVLIVRDFQPPLLPPVLARSMPPQVRCTNRCSRHRPPTPVISVPALRVVSIRQKHPPCIDRASSTTLLSVTHTRRRTDPMRNMPICFARSCNGRAGFRRRRCLIRICNYAW